MLLKKERILIMNNDIIKTLSQELGINQSQVETVLALLEDNTVPFIARYRKEQTGSLDETIIRDIAKAYETRKNLENRKEDVIRLIEERGMLTEDLKASILMAEKLVDVEDLYRPFKEKKKTKATEAIKKGLEPLSKILLEYPEGALEILVEPFLNEEVTSIEEALQGARDIIAETISDHPEIRKSLRNLYENTATLSSKVKKNADDEKSVYKDYYEYQTSFKELKPFRVLALNRGEKEKVLSVGLGVEEEKAITLIENRFLKPSQSKAVVHIQEAIKDGYKRLIKPSLERELRSQLTEIAEKQAVHVFGENLYQLLLQPPLKQQVILGVDPAYRTGCKCAVVSELGEMVEKTVIYPHQKFQGEEVPSRRIEEAKKTILELVSNHNVDIIAIGNGTASRETEDFIANLIADESLDVSYSIVSEAGASVYSASELARHEFPDLSVEERSAISIARRLQDPLSELVKIDPKSLGVGQYQHDVSKVHLNESLLAVVETAVNQVGVNVNTASPPLLTYVAGLSTKMAENIVELRTQKGAFKSRKALKKVKGLGPKSYEQAIGFLRILNGDHPLDKTSIHPESYEVTEELLKMVGASLDDIGSEKIRVALTDLSLSELSSKLNIGLETLQDIVLSLKQPLRDPRDSLPQPLLKKGVIKLEDLSKGDHLQGTIRNIVDFGAFVDCGVKTDGLVHISELARKFIKHPLDVVSIGQIVDVYVKDVDIKRGRLQLTMLKENALK